jgi:hypothetical protein
MRYFDHLRIPITPLPGICKRYANWPIANGMACLPEDSRNVAATAFISSVPRGSVAALPDLMLLKKEKNLDANVIFAESASWSSYCRNFSGVSSSNGYTQTWLICSDSAT